MAGLTAAVSFPTLRDLEPQLEPYAGYEGDHWPIAAGAVANNVFLIADAVQLILAMITAATLGYLAFRGDLGGRFIGIVRLLALGVALLAFGFQLFYLRPKMDVDLAMYWDAAKQADTERAESHRQAYNDRHPTVSNLMGATALASLTLSLAGAWAATRTKD